MPVPNTYSGLTYVTGTIVSPEWLNFINVWMQASIEGTVGCDVGEAYQPGLPIRIDGAGIATSTYLTLESGAAGVVESGASWTVESGATASFSGNISIKSGAFLTAESGGTIEFESGSFGIVRSGGEFTVENGGHFGASSGATVEFDGAVSFDGLISADGGITVADGQALTLAGTANRVALGSRSITRTVPNAFTISGTAWATQSDGSVIQTADGSGTALVPLDLPNGATLTSVSVVLDGASGHVGLPATMPSIELIEVTTGGAAVSLGTQTDTSADVASYEVAHTVTLGSLSVTVDLTSRRYAARILGERSTNYLSGLQAFVVSWACTMTEMPEH